MTIDHRIRDENYSMVLIEKFQKYQPYYQEKFINMNIIQVRKYYLLIKTNNRTS